jgi:uncharacterized glyoxalase superfamily protein PhnB
MPSADKDQVLSQRSDHLLSAVRDGPASDHHFLDRVRPILYGSLVDRNGICWMFNCDSKT